MFINQTQTRNRTKRNGRRNNTLLLVGNRRTPKQQPRIGEANKSPSSSSFFTSVTGILSGTVGAKRISNVKSASATIPQSKKISVPSTGLFSNVSWMNRSRSHQHHQSPPILSQTKPKIHTKSNSTPPTNALHRRGKHITNNNRGNLLYQTPSQPQPPSPSQPPPPRNGFHSSQPPATLILPTKNHDHVIPSFLITNVVRHFIVILLLSLIAILIPVVSSTPHTSFTLQTIVNAFILLFLMWLWISQSPPTMKPSYQPSINHGIMLSLLFHSIWILYGLLASHIFTGIPHVNMLNPVMETRNTSSYFWLTGWAAEGVSALVAVLSHIPGMSKRWPNMCRYTLGPLVLLLFFLPNPAIVTDPQLWSLTTHQNVWLTILIGVLRSGAIYLICVTSWQTTQFNKQTNKQTAWIQRIAICYCRILWLTQTTSILLVILGSLLSFGLILSDILSSSSAATSDDKYVRFQQPAPDPELGYKTPLSNPNSVPPPTSILKSTVLLDSSHIS